MIQPGVVTYQPESYLWFFIFCTAGTVATGGAGLLGEFPTAPKLAVLFLLLWLVACLLLWSGRKRLILRRDDLRGVLLVELERWPFASRTTTYPLAEVCDAVVEIDPMGDTSTHRVALVLTSGAQVPLTESFCGKGARHEDAVREIRVLLSAPPRPIR